MPKTLQFPRGSIITFTSGAYSDFGLTAFVVATQELNLAELAQEFVAKESETVKARGEGSWNKPKLDDFPSWLIASGYAMPVDNNTVHLGSYEDWEPEFGIKEN